MCACVSVLLPLHCFIPFSTSSTIAHPPASPNRDMQGKTSIHALTRHAHKREFKKKRLNEMLEKRKIKTKEKTEKSGCRRNDHQSATHATQHWRLAKRKSTFDSIPPTSPPSHKYKNCVKETKNRLLLLLLVTLWTRSSKTRTPHFCRRAHCCAGFASFFMSLLTRRRMGGARLRRSSRERTRTTRACTAHEMQYSIFA